MYNDLLRENIIVEITNLLNTANNEITDEYCIFMKEVILNTSGKN